MDTEIKTTVAADSIKVESENQENASVIDFKMVTFSLADKDYSIDIMHVKEIAKAGRFTYVPNTLPFVLGVYNLRGEIIPILDLRLFFNIEIPPRDENKLENMLILNVDDQIFGLVVDKIDKVVGVQKSTIQPPHPLFGDINIKYIGGVVESNNHLYVLLDVTKIFSSKETYEAGEANIQAAKVLTASQNDFVEVKRESMPQTLEKSPSDIAKSITQTSVSEKYGTSENSEVTDLKFISESLKNYASFYVSSVNESWVKRRYHEWVKEKGQKNALIQNKTDADAFLKPFWSTCNENWWTAEYAEKVEKLLPENSAKQIVVWNPGSGKGMETFSLACLLKKKYPDSKLRIYAQDIDLLNVSNAALLPVPQNLANDWYGPYLTKKANGDYTFSQDIKESIMFEYHDCKNTNALPMVDLIFARDILSLLDQNSQEALAADFLEKMKGNAVAVIGENENMPAAFNFGENTVDTLVAFTKD